MKIARKASERGLERAARAVLRGKIAVVTRARSGIGKAIPLNLGHSGAEACLVARRQDAFEEVAARETVGRIRHGLVLTCIAETGAFHCKESRRGAAAIDRAVSHILRHCGEPYEMLHFSLYRLRRVSILLARLQPSRRLPYAQRLWHPFRTTTLRRTTWISFSRRKLPGSLRVCAGIIDVLENDRWYCSRNPYCEPLLGRRNLSRSTGGDAIGTEISPRLWVLNLSDGDHSLLDIAERSGLPFAAVCDAASLLFETGLHSAV